MNFKFIDSVDQAVFAVTRNEWERQLSENPGNVSKPYYDANLEFLERLVQKQVQMADGGMGLCGVIEDGNEFMSSLIVVSHARPKSNKPLLKMLDMHIQPTLNLANAGPNYAELAWISATAIMGCLSMTTQKKFRSKELKVHAQFPLDKQFLASVRTAMMGNPEMCKIYDVSMHPNWLVITEK